MNKQLLLVIILTFFTISIQAQKISYGVKGGLNITNGRVTANSKKYSGTGIGFHAGGIARAELAPNISFQPALMLSMKRADITNLGGIDIRLLTLDLPLTVVYEKGKFFGGLGPDLNFGLTGKYNYDGDKYDLFNKDNNGRFSIKRLEIGLNVLAGYKLTGNMFVSANFTPGLNNLFNNSAYTSRSTKVHTAVIGLSFGTFLK